MAQSCQKKKILEFPDLEKTPAWCPNLKKNFPLWPVAKFGYVLLRVIAKLDTSQNWKENPDGNK
jgi:hypothetical protein